MKKLPESELQLAFDESANTRIKNTLNIPSNGKTKKLDIQRLFTHPDTHPYDEIEWDVRTASIINDKGKVLFERKNVQVPKSWSQTAINIVA